MRILIFSDLHGDYKRAEEIKAIWEEGNFDSIFLLGDILYHGPRNDLPPFYCPKKVIPILSELKDYITAVRGNCDAEVDQMVLPFNILDERQIVEVDGIPETKSAETVMKKDKSRANYYKYHSGERWDNVLNYDMAIRSDLCGIDGTVACLKAYLDQMD